MTTASSKMWGVFRDLDRLATTFCVSAGVVAATAFSGWAFDVDVLRSVHPTFISMKVNSALLLLLLSCATGLVPSKKAPRPAFRIALSLAVALAAILVLAQYVFGWNVGIDEALFLDRGNLSVYPPGRMPPITTACFVLMAASLLLRERKGKGGQLVAQFLACAVFIAAFQVIVIYTIGASQASGFAQYMQMALHTAFAFALLSLAFLLKTRNCGIMFIVFQANVGGRAATQLVLATVIVLPFVNALELRGEALGVFDPGSGNVFRLTCEALFFLTVVWRTALKLHKLDAERAEKDQEFHFLSEALPQLIWALDGAGRVNYVSPRWPAYTGRPFFSSLNDLELIHPDDQQNVRIRWLRALQNPEPFGLEYRLIHHSGEFRWQFVHFEPYKDASGRVLRWFGSCTDIHDRKLDQAIREELAVRERAALESSRLKSQFLAGVSHEIRTPINGVIGMISLLLDTPLSEEQRNYAMAIKASGNALLTVISDILDISKIEAGKLEFEEADFSLHQVMDEAWSTVLHEVHRKKLHHETSFSPSLPALVRGDAGRVRQVVTNLLSNAAKFTAEGSIKAAVERLECTKEKVVIRVSVRDTGIGVPQGALPRLFQAFSQGDSSMARRFGGTGLGLSICRSLVQEMGGAIGVESEEGVGSHFWFTLTLKPAHGVSQTPRVIPPLAPPAGRARILIAEDMEINRIISVRMVEKLGHTVHVVENGRQVLEEMRRHAFDLVLMDCQMPEMDGYEAASRIRSDPGIVNPELPIIAMTANAMRGEREKCVAVGMNDHLPKPFQEEELANIVAKWLAYKAPKSDAA